MQLNIHLETKQSRREVALCLNGVAMFGNSVL